MQASIRRKPTINPAVAISSNWCPGTRTLLPSTSPPSNNLPVISGHIWRLYPDSTSVGVGAAKVILSINGVDQPAASSMIDGFYQLDVPGIHPGDSLSLRAENPEDDFDPVAYTWQAERAVEKYEYDFYSYWGTIASPDSDDQNHIFGQVVDSSGRGVPGVYLLLQMGTSDALQRMRPTDAEGNYDAYVRLPDRIMVTVWVDGNGYLPSSVLFFHPYAAENREIDFHTNQPGK